MSCAHTTHQDGALVLLGVVVPECPICHLREKLESETGTLGELLEQKNARIAELERELERVGAGLYAAQSRLLELEVLVNGRDPERPEGLTVEELLEELRSRVGPLEVTIYAHERR